MSRVARNILYNLVGQGLVLLLGFVAVRYVLVRLGADALGILYFAGTLSAVLSAVAELGISSTLVREVSSYSQRAPDYLVGLIRTASLFYWTAYAVCAFGMYAGARYLVEHWLRLQSLEAATAQHVLQVFGLAALLALPRSLYISLLRGIQRMEFNNLIDVGSLALQQIGIVVILALGGDIFDVAHWFALSLVLGIALYVAVSIRFFSTRALVPGFSSTVVRRNQRYSLRMAAISLLSMVHMQADKVIVSRLLPLATFGFYGFASSVVSKTGLITAAISQAAFPSFSDLFAEGHRERLFAQYRKLQDLICFALVPVFVLLPFFAVPVLTYIVGGENARQLFWPVALLSVGTYMNATLHAPYVFSLAAGKPEIAARQNLYALAVVLPATWLLVSRLGMVGAGLSWIWYHMFAYSYGVPRICRECLEMKPEQWYQGILRALLLAAGTYGAGGVVLAAIAPPSLLWTITVYSIATAAFTAGAYRTVESGLREDFTRLLETLRLRLA